MATPDEFPEVPIQMEAVLGSTHVAASGYDEDTSIMVIEYQNGTQYRWDGIPQSAYDGLRQATSAGKYLRALEQQFGKGARIS